MASIIKVDTIQHSDGSTPTMADLGLNVQGSVLNVHLVEVPWNHTTYDTFDTTSQATITGFSITVTPSSVDSEFIIESFPHVYLESNNAAYWTGFNLRVTRSVSGQSDVVLGGGGSGAEYQYANYASGGANTALDMGNGMLIVKDEPNTTSSVTYVGTASAFSTTADVVVHRYGSGFFRVTEIAG